VNLFALLLAASSALPSSGGEDPKPVVPASSAAARWGADYFPNVPLVTHEGRTVRFFDDLIEGKVVVVNFIYTTCPDACPLETAKLSEVCTLLGDRVGQDVFLYSISIDPERDTPEVLREYSERYQTPPGWLFLTGEAADIRLVREKLGMIRADETELQQHTLNLLIGNQATGKWMKRSPMENPYFLATQIGSWLSDWRLPPEPGLDYAEAPELRSISRGENLFRTRCSACHLIGPDDGLPRQGPNLLGVTERRERAWLARWIAEPDVMLAEGDPLAVELSRQWRNLPMPNMRLNPLEVEALLEYMREESDWHAEEASPRAEGVIPDSEKPGCCQKEDGLLVGDETRGPTLLTTGDDFTGSELQPLELESIELPRAVGTPAFPGRALWLALGLFGFLGLIGLGLGRALPGDRP
jgi:protein SCO1/2